MSCYVKVAIEAMAQSRDVVSFLIKHGDFLYFSLPEAITICYYTGSNGDFSLGLGIWIGLTRRELILLILLNGDLNAFKIERY